MANVTLGVEETAASCYRAVRAASGSTQGEWDALSLEAQVPFLRTARHGPALLERLEGAGWREVARAVFAEACPEAEGAWEALPEPYKRAWEAGARHLAALLDADDIDNVEGLENSWREWAKRRGNAT